MEKSNQIEDISEALQDIGLEMEDEIASEAKMATKEFKEKDREFKERCNHKVIRKIQKDFSEKYDKQHLP